MLILWIICGILFSTNVFQTSASPEGEKIWIERGKTAALKCPIKIETCGELHAVTWFKKDVRVAVVSGNNKHKKVEPAFSDRFSIEYKTAESLSYLTLSSTEIADEDEYTCDRTYITPSENCEIAAYSIYLNVYVEPYDTLITDENGKNIPNNTRLGPYREGYNWKGICEARGGRPAPPVGWYRNNKLITTRTVPVQDNGLFNVKSELTLILSREDMESGIECRIESPGKTQPKTYLVKFDLQVRPTKITLKPEKPVKHLIQGEQVILNCEVSGARPEANITWYNETVPLFPHENHPVNISTGMAEIPAGTFTTTSTLIFTATMYESGKRIRCEADNLVMRVDMEKPMHDIFDVEVLYPPVINATNEYILVNESSEVFLICSYLSNPASLTDVTWYRNGEEINLNQSRFQGGNPENPSLNIKRSLRADSGNYTCELSNSIGTTKSSTDIIVDVQYPPIVLLGMEPESPIIENHEANVTLNCSVQNGNPPILTKVRWFLEAALLKELPECTGNQTDDNEDLCNIDPSKLLLQNVGRDFLGNYSCEGFNDVGWGPRSEELPLVVYYEPGNATLTHVPETPVKGSKVTFKCIVKAHGFPVEQKYRFYRGGRLVKDSNSSEYTTEAVLDNRANFSCYAYNDGGEGIPGTDELDVHVPPTFITSLAKYTGIHYKGENGTLICPVQCYPICDVMWFKNSTGINETNGLYIVKVEYLPPNPSTGDFETTVSSLSFNMSAWPGGVLDIHEDDANYSCGSTNNTAGPGVRSSTYVNIEYPPMNTTVSIANISVEEGIVPQRVTCSTKSEPEPLSYEWRHNGEVLAYSATLIFDRGMKRSDAGDYVCIARNKHGEETNVTRINVLYKPTCGIVRKEQDEKDTLICTAEGNPTEVSYAWSMKSENETTEVLNGKIKEQSSYLILDEDFATTREYQCTANNSVGVGLSCKIDVGGRLPWYQNWEGQTLVILVASILAIVLAAIIICIIIVCICRRRRRQNKLHGKSSALGDPLTEPGEYENLPFHGLQTAPNKPLGPADLIDELDYADVEYRSYGPINYKAASIYALVKKQKSNNNNNTGPLKEVR